MRPHEHISVSQHSNSIHGHREPPFQVVASPRLRYMLCIDLAETSSSSATVMGSKVLFVAALVLVLALALPRSSMGGKQLL